MNIMMTSLTDLTFQLLLLYHSVAGDGGYGGHGHHGHHGHHGKKCHYEYATVYETVYHTVYNKVGGCTDIKRFQQFCE